MHELWHNAKDIDFDDLVRLLNIALATFVVIRFFRIRGIILRWAQPGVINMFLGLTLASLSLGEVSMESWLRNRGPNFSAWVECLALLFIVTGQLRSDPRQYIVENEESREAMNNWRYPLQRHRGGHWGLGSGSEEHPDEPQHKAE